jgi:TPP-dependent pyruvate/acetoin dehydrogenase alpha subunit
MDVGVKRKDEMNDWLPKDPLSRSRTLCKEMGISSSDLDQMDERVKEEVQAAVLFARQSLYPGNDELLAHVFVTSGGAR